MLVRVRVLFPLPPTVHVAIFGNCAKICVAIAFIVVHMISSKSNLCHRNPIYFEINFVCSDKICTEYDFLSLSLTFKSDKYRVVRCDFLLSIDDNTSSFKHWNIFAQLQIYRPFVLPLPAITIPSKFVRLSNGNFTPFSTPSSFMTNRPNGIISLLFMNDLANLSPHSLL